MGLSQTTIAQSAEHRIEPLKRNKQSGTVLVNEIFVSIQGESSFAGRPCVFVRTTGCHLRCSYCDTDYAFFDGTWMHVDDILAKVKTFGVPLVEITGGEPLLQPAVFDLLKRLCDDGYTVLLETSGAVSIKQVDRRVHAIVDIKTPKSGEMHRNVMSNLAILWPGCEVKFVICDDVDYQFSKNIVETYALDKKCTVLLSPESETMPKEQLAEWIVRDRLPVRYQLQLHKILWGDRRGV